jgi:hypothetical protein
MNTVVVLSHASDKNKDGARLHPTDEDLSAGASGWGTRLCGVPPFRKVRERMGHGESSFQRGGGKERVEGSHPFDDEAVERMGHGAFPA